MAIKAIPTRYKGYHFRSRLEARWAVFFDELEIEWDYELEGFILEDGTPYLPDFWLPTFNGGLWCEVKPNGGDFSTAIQFAEDKKSSIWLCEGVPDFAIYQIVGYTNIFDIHEMEFRCGIPNWSSAYKENRMFGQPCEFRCENKCSSVKVVLDTEEKMNTFRWSDCYSEVADAIVAARSARFEFGENK